MYMESTSGLEANSMQIIQNEHKEKKKKRHRKKDKKETPKKDKKEIKKNRTKKFGGIVSNNTL